MRVEYMFDAEEEKEIFVDIIMDLLILADLDGIAHDEDKENKMRIVLLNASWDTLNKYYNQIRELSETKRKLGIIDIILREIDEIGVEAVRAKYGIAQ